MFRALSGLTAALAVALTLGIAPAQAAQPTDETAAGQIEGWLVDNGVGTATVDALMEKLMRGEAWDSFGGSEPVAVEDRKLNGVLTTVSTFADGSIVLTGSAQTNSSQNVVEAFAPETGQASIAPLSDDPINLNISECLEMGDPTWYRVDDCYIFYSSGLITMSFRDGWEAWKEPGAMDRVFEPYDEAKLFIGAHVDYEVLERTREWETPTAPAEARYKVSATITIGNVPISTDANLRLHVANNVGEAVI